MLAKDLMLPTTEVVHLDQSLHDADVRLRRFRLPALPVVDGDEIVGLLTAEALQDMTETHADLAETAVRDHMSAEVAFCQADEDIETAHAIMEQGGHRRILVIDRKGRLCGQLSSAEAAPYGSGEGGVAAEHTVKTPGRARGSALHKPPGFSVQPRIKK